jgi:site-specific recombinase
VLANLVTVGQERRSLRALLASNSSLLAAKVAERSAETGEHYITRTPANTAPWWARQPGGGGGDGLHHLDEVWACMHSALSAFWGGFWRVQNYALSFVLIQLLHFTWPPSSPP